MSAALDTLARDIARQRGRRSARRLRLGLLMGALLLGIVALTLSVGHTITPPGQVLLALAGLGVMLVASPSETNRSAAVTEEAEEADRTSVQTKVRAHQSFFTGEDAEMSWQLRRQYDEFTYGYCLTVHKSQGSQWDSVYLFDESFVFRDEAQRWLYTGITRAAERITVVR